MLVLSAIAVVSCTERLKEPPVPENLNTNTTIVSASIAPIYFEGVEGEEYYYSWSEKDVIGLYGAGGGDNVKYSVVKTSLSAPEAEEGIAKFYGQVVSGDISAYFPYNAAGHVAVLEDRIPIPSVQRFYATPYEHAAANAIFVAQCEDKHLDFMLSAALLKVVVPVEVSGVETIKLTVQNTSAETDAFVAGNLALVEGVTPKFTDGSVSISLTNVGRLNSTKSEPLVFYALVAEGTYENFVVTLAGNGWVVNKPLDTDAPIVTQRGVMTECRVLDVDYNYGAGDFGSEGGSFTQQ